MPVAGKIETEIPGIGDPVLVLFKVNGTLLQTFEGVVKLGTGSIQFKTFII